MKPVYAVSALTVSFALVVTGGTAPVSADETVEEIDEIALLVEEMKPESIEEISFGASSDVAENIVPPEGNGDFLEMPLGDDDNPEPLISLPEELSVQDVVVASDGTSVYQVEDSDDAVTVSVTDDGNAQIAMVSTEPSSPHDFTFGLADGMVPDLQSSGAVVLRNEAGEAVAIIDVPWAVDAEGHRVETHFEVFEQEIVQVVNASEDATYPIVSDPTVATFTTHGDNVHISSSSPRAVSAHGWWKTSNAQLKTKTAKVTVYLQYKSSKNAQWRIVAWPSENKKPSKASTTYRTTARRECRSHQSRQWRSIVDVDINGVIDSPEKKYTPTKTLKCAL